MKNLNTIFKSASLVAAVLVLSACGSQSSKDTGLTSSGNTSGGTISTTSSGNIYNLPSAPQQRIQLSGQNGGAFAQTMQVTTSRTLRVKVEAQGAPHLTLSGYTNWVFPYGCMRVTVSVNGSTRTTKILKVAGTTQLTAECANAPSTEILDFTNMMTGSGNKINVTFSNAEYDNCRYYNVLQYGCGMSAVWQNHQVAFNATVQTDSTYME